MRHRGHPGYGAFVVHRLSGLALILFLPLHFLALGLALEGAAALDGFLAWADRPLVKLAEIGLVILLTAHLAAGLRLLWLEWGWGGRGSALVGLGAGASLLAGAAFAVIVFAAP